MPEKRYGRQTPTRCVVLPYDKTEGNKAVELYNGCGNTAQPWQELIEMDLLAVDNEGIYIHSKYGFQVSRRNGKGEIILMRELYALCEAEERVLHTAHRTTTSTSASKRLATCLKNMGYEEVERTKKGEVYDKHFVYTKQRGLEKIWIIGKNGVVEFRTRTSSGGLGEGFDLWIADEAQELTVDQENTLKFTVSDSNNPQIIMTGTPPTAVSKGTVFTNLRTAIFEGSNTTAGWSEWSVEFQSDPKDVDLWYETNPAMGYQLNERKVREEIGEDEIDFNIQRLGWWPTFNQKAFFSSMQWDDMEYVSKPVPRGKIYVGIKYGKDDQNVSLSICVKTDSQPLVESIDCRPINSGNAWIIGFLKNACYEEVVCDGANGMESLQKEMKDAGIKTRLKILNTGQIISANALFKQGIEMGLFQHGGQPSLRESVTNCQKRAIGSNGGYGFASIKEGVDISLLDSAMLAYYICMTSKPKKKMKASY